MKSARTLEWYKDRIESQQDYLDVLKHRQHILQKETAQKKG